MAPSTASGHGSKWKPSKHISRSSSNGSAPRCVESPRNAKQCHRVSIGGAFMPKTRFFPLLLLALPLLAADDDVVFRSDVSLVRVDAQVLDGNRAITGLRREDFILRESGQVREIRNFSNEDMPVDL